MGRVILLLAALVLGGCGLPLHRLTTVDAAGRPHNVPWEAAACAGAVRAGRSRAWAACRER